jgi:hypothetical protein
VKSLNQCFDHLGLEDQLANPRQDENSVGGFDRLSIERSRTIPSKTEMENQPDTSMA